MGAFLGHHYVQVLASVVQVQATVTASGVARKQPLHVVALAETNSAYQVCGQTAALRSVVSLYVRLAVSRLGTYAKPKPSTNAFWGPAEESVMTVS